MANSKITDLAAGVLARTGNLVEMVQSVLGVPTSVKVTTEQLFPSVDMPPATPNAMDDEFEAAVLDAKWTWRNQGTGSATLKGGILCLRAPTTGAAAASCRIIEQNIPAAPYEFTAKVACTSNDISIPTYFKTGLALIESSSGKLTCFGAGNGTSPSIQVVNMNSVTAFNSTVASACVPTPGMFYYFRISDDGTNLRYYTSTDNIVYYLRATQARLAFLTTGANKIGLMSSSENNALDCLCNVDWFRRTA